MSQHQHNCAGVCSANKEKSHALFYAYVLMAVLLLSSIVVGTVWGDEPKSSAEGRALRVLTQEELQAFDGKDGRPAYYAYEGAIYDVTGSSYFKDGKHPGGHLAGEDLSGKLEKAPHGEEVFEEFSIVGVLAGSDAEIVQTSSVNKQSWRPIMLLNKSLTAWTGYLLGITFVLNFLTCFVMPWRRGRLPWMGRRPGKDEWDDKGYMQMTMLHTYFAWACVVTGSVHGVLGILMSFGIYL